MPMGRVGCGSTACAENEQALPKHGEACGLMRAEAGGTLARNSLFFSTHVRAAGKAVKTGHSCAAVTYQSRPTPRGTNARAKPIGVASGEGEGRGARGERSSCGHIRSPNIPSGHAHASAAKLLRAVEREIFIAKMKRESGCFSGRFRNGVGDPGRNFSEGGCSCPG